MNNKIKRALSALLCLAMMIGFVPMIPVQTKAAEGDASTQAAGQNFVSLPVTIRDFATDGMLFEFIQFEDPDEYYVESPTEYAGLKAYFAEAPEVDVADFDQNGTNGTGKRQMDGYVRYYPGDNGLKLSFRMVGLNNGADYIRNETDWVVIKYRTSKEYSAQNYPTIKTIKDGETYSYKEPIVAQRGSNASDRDLYGAKPGMYNSDRTLSVYGENKDQVVKSWKEMCGTSPDGASGSKSGEWQYAKVHLSGNATDEVQYISIYINQKQGHVDFDGMWVFNSRASAEAFLADGYQFETHEYYLGDNKGYGMLMTDDNDYYNSLPSDKNNIAGSQLFINGSWGDTTEPKAIDATLNSGAKQKIHGAVIRTDLVEAKLDEDRKPVYTDATVSYIKGMLKKTLPVVWERTPEHGADKAYNLYHVMGVKLYNDALEYVGPGAAATKDLAQLLREKITGDGTLEETKAKVAAGNLTKPTDIATYYDAAYYLLHNTWRDSEQDTATTNDGYGMPISAYNRINLVETTNSKNQKCYVFNSGYDNTAYDSANGVIYNTQVETMTKVQDISVHSTGIIRGMVMPEARFDPLNSMGYGKSGNIYAEEGLRKDQWKDTYYAETNYNLSLEGHAQFIYYEASDQYFTFTGDDDVYLYINGTRVLDVGAAHSISKVSINLNDVAKLCGLVDGQVYSFDFFYMERHGTAANFGVETNIQIVDPSMTTTKTGYQNDTNTGYNGYVNPEVPMTYEFALENKGQEAIENVTFTDSRIGVVLTKDSLTMPENTVADLMLTLYNPNGSVKSSVLKGSLTEDALKQYLQTGLAVGEKLVIYGFKHTILDSEWETRQYTDAAGNTVTSNEYYYNMVTTTAVGASGQELSGIANWVVQEQDANYEDIHLYTWGNLDTTADNKTVLVDGGQSVALSKAELAAVVKKANSNYVVKDTDQIKICTANGITDSSQTNNLNPRAEVDGSTVKYDPTNTGADNYYVMVGTYGPIRVTVYTYGVAPNVYVLDYNLPVRLSGSNSDSPLVNNDIVDLGTSNPLGTAWSITGISGKVEQYGEFDLADGVLTYRMQKFLNGEDKVTVTIDVIETGKTEISKYTGVTMTQTVSVVPASVMYYEDDFIGNGALTYVDANGEAWVTYETTDSEGNYQSADQDMNYGSDPNYSVDKQQEYTMSNNGSDTDVLVGDSSNGTIHVRNVVADDKPAEILNFTFVGTGFEILSRTTNADYAVLNVKVTNTEGNLVRMLPVICECENGDLYQVPVISITDLERGTYNVQLQVAYNASETNTNPRVYIDGIRIYSPLAEDQESEFYTPDEAAAEIIEIKQLIVGEDVITDGSTGEAIGNPKVVYASVYYSEEEEKASFKLATGDTVIENYGDDEGMILNTAVDLDDYLTCGPNNELYLDGSSGTSVIAFYAKPVEGSTPEQRTIQVGAHRKTDSSFDDVESDTDYVTLVYGSTAADVEVGSYSHTVASGTEQYYTIDVAKLTKDEQGRYLVLIGANFDCSSGAVLVLTNLKISGYTIESIDFELDEFVLEDIDTGSYMFRELKYLCGVTENDPVEPVAASLTGKQFSVSLEDEVLLNFYFSGENLEDAEVGTLVFDADPGMPDILKADQVLGAVYDGASDLYMSQSDGIPAKEMGDTHYYAAYAKLADGSMVYSAVYAYSPKQYAMNRIEKSSDQNMKALCVALLNYGAEAQLAFGYRTDDLMNADLTDEQRSWVTPYSADLFQGAVAADTAKVGNFVKTNTGFYARTASVSMDAAFAINYYFAPDTAPDGEVTFYYWTSDAYAAAATLTAENASGSMTMALTQDGSYWANIKGIAAKQLDETFYVAGVYTADGETFCTGIIAYSISKYCMNKISSGSDIAGLAAAMAVYGHHAKEYFPG